MPRKKSTKKSASWVTYEKGEVEALINRFAAEGRSAARIGLVLRDQYGIPDARKYNLRLGRMVDAAQKKEVPEDMYNLMKQSINLRDHLKRMKKDAKGRHALESMESKIRRLGKYYVRKHRLPTGWKYSSDRARLIVKG